MKRLFLILFSLCLFSGCGHGPIRIIPDTADPFSRQIECQSKYPAGGFQMVHRIDASMPGGGRATFLGVTVFSTERNTIRCILMTLEGFVLFSAEEDGGIRVTRAVPPFDKGQFAKEMLSDLRLLFFFPRVRVFETGLDDRGNPACRYEGDDGGMTSMILHPDGTWKLFQYKDNSRLDRTIESVGGTTDALTAALGFPNRVFLERFSPGGYRLDLTLIEAKRIPE
jgi:hypothetical protein